MKRIHLILAAVLAIQVALTAFVFWPRPAAAPEGEPLFSDLETGDIVALTVTDLDGNRIALRKVAGEWVLSEADDYPAKADRISPFLEKVLGLSTGRLVTRTDASHRQLQVASDEFLRRIDLETADGEEYTVYLGSSPGYSTTHFRLEGQSEVYLVDGLTAWDTSTSTASWIDTSYLSVAQEDVTTLTLENDSGTLVFRKDEDGNWTMEGLVADESLDETQVGALVRQGTSMAMLEPLGTEGKTEYGMDEPSAVVTLETAGATITLRVGAQDPDGNGYIVISSESPYYARVAEASVQSLVETTRDDFVIPAPIPTEEPSPLPTPTSEGEEGEG
jgi:hypothetical protein